MRIKATCILLAFFQCIDYAYNLSAGAFSYEAEFDAERAGPEKRLQPENPPLQTLQISLDLCDPTDPAQKWYLNRMGWGSNNTIQNDQLKTLILNDSDETGENHDNLVSCIDVYEWKVSQPGALLTAHACCGLASQKTACKDPQKNYNQQWTLEKTLHSSESQSFGRVRVMNEDRQSGLCLDAINGALPGSAVSISECDEARNSEQIWTVTANGSSPVITISTAAPSPSVGDELCLTVAKPSPAPGPTPISYRGCQLPNITGLPFCDTSLSSSARAKDFVSRMTLSEKLRQLIGGIGGGITPAVPRLGLPPYQYHSEGLHGLRSTCRLTKQPLFSTMFPQVTGMAATFNMSLINAMAAHMADEARAINNILEGKPSSTLGGGLNYWGPTLNIGRDPRWGRFQESVSEDPFLNGLYSFNFVRGFQGTGDKVNFTKVAACCKHFYACKYIKR